MDLLEKRLQRIRKQKEEIAELKRRISFYEKAKKEIKEERERALGDPDRGFWELGLWQAYQIILKYEKM